MPQWAMAQVGSAFSASSKISLAARVPERVLVAHGAVEAALRHLVARGLEADVAELLIDVALRDMAATTTEVDAAMLTLAASKDFRIVSSQTMWNLSTLDCGAEHRPSALAGKIMQVVVAWA